MKTPPGFYTEQELKNRASDKQIAYLMRGIISQENDDIHPTLKRLFKIDEKEETA